MNSYILTIMMVYLFSQTSLAQINLKLIFSSVAKSPVINHQNKWENVFLKSEYHRGREGQLEILNPNFLSRGTNNMSGASALTLCFNLLDLVAHTMCQPCLFVRFLNVIYEPQQINTPQPPLRRAGKTQTLKWHALPPPGRWPLVHGDWAVEQGCFLVGNN